MPEHLVFHLYICIAERQRLQERVSGSLSQLVKHELSGWLRVRLLASPRVGTANAHWEYVYMPMMRKLLGRLAYGLLDHAHLYSSKEDLPRLTPECSER